MSTYKYKQLNITNQTASEGLFTHDYVEEVFKHDNVCTSTK